MISLSASQSPANKWHQRLWQHFHALEFELLDTLGHLPLLDIHADRPLRLQDLLV